MMTETEIKIKGLKALSDALGQVEAERFIALMLREPFDYTEWQKNMWIDRDIKDISKAAMDLRRKINGKKRK